MRQHKVRTIIVEGVDCSGKTTLCKELKNALRWDLLALPHRDGWQFSRYLRVYGQAEDTILERSHISEEVYSPVFGRSNPFTRQEEQTLRSILTTSAIVILATAPDEILRARYRERDYYQELAEEKLVATNQAFLKQFARYPGAILYDSSNKRNLERLVSAVKKQL